MQERNIKDILFSLDQERFDKIWTEKNWFKLQLEFKTKKVELSQSLLIWNEESGKTWLLTDFEHQKTYQIENKQDTGSNLLTQVSELSGPNEHLENIETICSRLQMNPQTGQMPEGTQHGFIDLLQKLNLDEIDIEKLKRPNLSGSGLSFESVHPNLLVVYEMFCVILTLSREKLINLPNEHVGNVRSYLPQLYEIAQKIDDFDISGENPTEMHADLLKEVSDFCNAAKNSLSQTITYLKFTQIDQLEGQINVTIDDAMKTFNVEVERAKKNNEDAEVKETERQEKFEQLERDVEDLIRKKSISSYEKIFADQTEEHRKGAKFWLSITSLLAVGFSLIFWWFIKDLAPAGSQLPAILQNLVAKGFFLSLIYLFLNRSIKNYTAEKHLQTVNRHRQNALATFEEFEKAAGKNQETRDAVLLACTDAIFDANQSGYLSTKTGRSESAAPIQMVKGFVPTKPPTDSD